MLFYGGTYYCCLRLYISLYCKKQKFSSIYFDSWSDLEQYGLFCKDSLLFK